MPPDRVHRVFYFGDCVRKTGKLQAYSDSSNETDDPSKILDYHTGLSSLHPASAGRVLTAYNERVIRLFDVSPLVTSSRF